MKRNRIFAAVVYFIFTFGIGLVFAFTLPGYFATFTVPADVVEEALEKGDFLTALVLTEPVGFKRTPVLHREFSEGGGVILFEAVMEVYDREGAKEDASGLTHGMLYKCYEGYVYGVSERYDVYAEENNKTALVVVDADGAEKTLPILDFDTNGDGKSDGISTLEQSGFLVLEIRESDVSSVRSLRFTDKEGNAAFSADAEEDLRFESDFFDCFGDLEEYNKLLEEGTGLSEEETAARNKERNAYVERVSAALEKAEGCELTSRCSAYEAAAKEVDARANRKAIPFVIVYFVVIYIIADFLLGSHYIIKFFRWFLFKVCKIPHKAPRASEKEVFGHDYFSMVTLKLDTEEVPEFRGSVEIKYTNTEGEALFTLLHEDGYSATVRLKAGTYVNPFIDIDRAYAPVDLPDNLEVVGYQTEIVVKIVKRGG